MLRILTVAATLLLAGAAHAQMSTNNRTPTNCSGTITAGGTSQVLIPANTGVSGFLIQNIDTTEPLWMSFNGAAVAGNQGSYAIPAATATTFAGSGSYYSMYGYNLAISVVAATTGHKFSCTRW